MQYILQSGAYQIICIKLQRASKVFKMVEMLSFPIRGKSNESNHSAAFTDSEILSVFLQWYGTHYVTLLNTARRKIKSLYSQ